MAGDDGAWLDLDPQRISLREIFEQALAEAADASREPFGPGARFRVVVEILAGRADGDPFVRHAARTEIILDATR
ncbi:hypothetical protein [Streptomyces candidus]|uniref:Uncharacterized protein n=1 Tax=Streptomyces candidus TaxID=67283 RepID=A0A7X0HLN6_9ACTN|nr:hypothetical protein [Streptomyces candidus]MBB6439956.1 hypothetical protein [Streptomyces candidus]GHH56119.1 hypothetical protein GCM10018773_61500 [Streptomyces candidus]